MTNFGKTVFLKTMVLVTLLLAASLLVTCDLLFPPEDDGGEYTDVEYEVIGAPGNQRVKSIKVYLMPDNLDKDALPGPNTYGVKKSAEQRAIERALTLEGARMSHDYFEAVFITASSVARAAWEIGQPAGIRGVSRGAAVGDYRGLSPGATGSTVFVGRKTGKTLLGVGYMTAINDLPTSSGNILDTTYSVTFTVSALATWVGFNETTSGGTTTYDVNTTRKDVGGTTGVLNAGATFVTGYTTPAGTPSATTTKGENITPRGTGAKFPMYYLPSVKNATADFTVKALYMVGGLTITTVDATDATYAGFPTTGIASAVRIWGTRGASGSYPESTLVPPLDSVASTADLKGGLQWIKRTPAFMSGGINYEINDTFHDKVTKIDETTEELATYPAAGDAFPTAGLPVTFNMITTVGRSSGGIFAVTFQVPVYALVPDRARNPGSLPPERWWVRPDYSQYQYLLDNGVDSGGAVLLGTDVEGGGGDWIQINTVGIGFNNE